MTNQRQGFAGVHDLIDKENINVELKRAEVLNKQDSIYLPPPPRFIRGKHKMLLVQGPHDERSGTAIFPLGLGYLARVLSDIGVGVDVLDAHAEKLTQQETIDKIRTKQFDLVGITALSTQYTVVKWLAAELKRLAPSVKIIVGGQLAHYNAHTVIEHTLVDICVIGEGEITIQEIIYNLSDLSKVKGIAYRTEDGQYKRNLDQTRIANPDVIPFPKWDVFNMEYYLTTGFFGSHAKHTMNILSSRGCPYSCTFCSLSFPNVTNRSIDNVIEEINLLKENYNVDGIMFSDELFVISKKRVYEFCEKIKAVNINWGGQGRANIVNDDEKLLRAMKDSGATYIGYGLESATDEMLSKMQKKTSVEQNINAVNTAHKVGLVVVAQYLFGFPGESMKSIKEGIDFFDKVHYVPPLGLQAAPHMSLTTALPGSQLYVDCQKDGKIKCEDEYLTKIGQGYFYNKDVVMNLTDFSDEELLELKKIAENKTLANYIKWSKENKRFFILRHYIQDICNVYKWEGFFVLCKHIVRKFAVSLKKVLTGKIGIRYFISGKSFSSRTDYQTDYAYKTRVADEFIHNLK